MTPSLAAGIIVAAALFGAGVGVAVGLVAVFVQRRITRGWPST